jgi:uncharacterized protein YegP (UPF0339 family)
MDNVNANVQSEAEVQPSEVFFLDSEIVEDDSDAPVAKLLRLPKSEEDAASNGVFDGDIFVTADTNAADAAENNAESVTAQNENEDSSVEADGNSNGTFSVRAESAEQSANLKDETAAPQIKLENGLKATENIAYTPDGNTEENKAVKDAAENEGSANNSENRSGKNSALENGTAGGKSSPDAKLLVCQEEESDKRREESVWAVAEIKIKKNPIKESAASQRTEADTAKKSKSTSKTIVAASAKTSPNKTAVAASAKTSLNKPSVNTDVNEADKRKTADKNTAQTAQKEKTMDKNGTTASSTGEKLLVEGDNSIPHGKFVIKKTDKGNFIYKLFSFNHRVVAIGAEQYSSLATCKTGVVSVINNADSPIEDLTLKNVEEQKNPKWQIYADKAGEIRLRLFASNGNIVATTNDGYCSKGAAKKGIEAIARAAKGAEIVRNDNLW